MESSFRIGDWLVEPLQNRVVRGDTKVRLDPKVMQVLVYLAERSNEVALKEEIIESVWDGAFVTDEVLTNAIFELRKALGDDAREPRFIQTVPRKGYRLVVPVEAPNVERRITWGTWVAVVGLGIAAIAGWLLARTTTIAPEPRVTPLTGFPGAEWWPALSPEGDRVAYVWDGGKAGTFDLYVQMVGGRDPLRLTNTSAHEYGPAWSPDGLEIAFLREGEIEKSELIIISALGGQERQLAVVAASDRPGTGQYPGLAWSPDGRFLALGDRASPEEPATLFLLSLDSGERRRVHSGPPGDSQPAFSSDGKALAYVHAQSEIYLKPLDDGDPKLLVAVEGWVADLDWTADGSAILFASGTENQAGTSLFRVSVNGGTSPKRLPFGEMAHTLSIARRGARVVYDHRSYFNTDVWRIDGPAASERGTPLRLIASSRFDWAQEYSPDGTKIAFNSERSGSNDIWVCDSDGSNCFQLTDMAGAYWPRWSPDSKRIVFHSRGSLYVGEVDRRFTRRLTPDDSGNVLASWSHDGAWIYFTSRRTGESQVWKVPVAGGEAIQITRKGGMNPRESEDGRFLYYADRRSSCTIRRVPVGGGEELPVTEGREVQFVSWSLWGNQIVYATGAPQDRLGYVESLDLDSGKVERIFASEAGLGDGLSVSTDGRSILLSMGEPEVSDLMLVEGFR